jgi:hypothetical protein
VARVEKIITYTKPKTLHGALVQLALACDTLSDIDSVLQAEKDKILGRRLLQMDRILRSAIRQCGLRSAIRQTPSSDPWWESIPAMPTCPYGPIASMDGPRRGACFASGSDAKV